MRNLKRALSLTLASVMLLGMMIVGTSAASFPDVDDNNNVEAIEVLNAVGVIVGDNGNFNPDKNVTRNEMAVIMAKLILGTYAADSYVGTHPFTDVPTWADRYVAACYASGIVAGRSATTYDGQATVTAVEAAAMMLRALGYEDLSKNAARWDQPVAAKANEINLFEGMNGNGNAPMNRDSVAKLALNTLEATVVNTERSGVSGTLPGGIEFNTTLNYKAVERPSESGNYAGSATGADGLGYQQLCEKLYGTNAKALKKNSTTDAFGRPATEWRYDNKEINKYADEADATYTAKVKIKDIYADLGLSESTTAAVEMDGASQGNITLIKTGTSDLDNSGKGVLVQAYKTDSGVKICIVNTYAGKVSSVTAAKDGNDRYITVTALSDTVSGGRFETEGFAKDDIVLFTKAGSDIKTVALAEKVDGQKVTSFTGANTAATKLTAGSTYGVAAKGKHDTAIAIDSSYDLYLDSYGYVIYTKLYEAGDSNWAYVLDAGRENTTYDDGDYRVKLLLADGTVAEGKSDKNYTNTATSATNKLIGHVVTYTLNSDDEYELTDKGAGITARSIDGGNHADVTVTLKTGTAKITVVKAVTGIVSGGHVGNAGTTTVNAGNNTVFVVGTKSASSTKYTYTVYTGITNAPKIDGAGVASFAAGVDKGVAKYVFIQAADTAVTSENDQTIFVKGGARAPKDERHDANRNTYYEYKAMIDGSEVTLKVKTGESTIINSNLNTNVWLKGYTQDKDGFVTGVTTYGTYNPASPATAGTPATRSNGTKLLDGDLVQLGHASGDTYAVKDGSPVVVVENNTNKTMTPGSVSDVVDSTHDTIYAVIKNDQIIAMAIIRDGNKGSANDPITEGGVMGSIEEGDVNSNPDLAGITNWTVTGLSSTTDGDGVITVKGEVPYAKQITKDTVDTIPGFPNLISELVDAWDSGSGTAHKVAIIPLQAEDGHINLYYISAVAATNSMTTAKVINITDEDTGTVYRLTVKFNLTWAAGPVE